MSSAPVPESDSLPEVRTSGPAETTVGTIEAVAYAYAGPLPPPGILREYDELVPGSAERILVQFEQQSIHRREMERAVVQTNIWSQRVGSLAASAIGITGVGGGVWLTYLGRSVEGLGALLATLGSLVGVYLYSRHEQTAERKDRIQQMRVTSREEDQ